MARRHRGAVGPVEGLQSAMPGPGERLDLQTGPEAAGQTDERFRMIANLGPEFDAMWGRAPNPGGRPDLPPSAFGHQQFTFHGLGGDLADDPNWWQKNLARLPQQTNRLSLPQAMQGLVSAAPGYSSMNTQNQ